jgi:hypothetical protein
MYALKMKGKDEYWSSDGRFWWSNPGRAVGAFKGRRRLENIDKYEVVKIAYITVIPEKSDKPEEHPCWLRIDGCSGNCGSYGCGG